jgi:hypothetical protein
MGVHDQIPPDPAISRHVAQWSSPVEPSGPQHSDRINDGRHQAIFVLAREQTLGPSPYSRSYMELDGGIQTTAAWPSADTAMVSSDRHRRQDRACPLQSHLPATEAKDLPKMVRAGTKLPAAAAGASPCRREANPIGPPCEGNMPERE